MSGVNNINITLLKQYQVEFNREKENFDNNTYNTYKTSYIPKCQDYYVKQMAAVLENLYDAIRNGYYNINIWWLEYNSNIENAENSLTEQRFIQNEELKNLLITSTQTGAIAATTGAAVITGSLNNNINENTASNQIQDNDAYYLDISAFTGATSGDTVTSTLSGFDSLWTSTKETINSAVNWTRNAINNTGAWISNAWNSVTNWVGNAQSTITNFLNSAGAKISDAWESVKEFGNEVKETIKAAGATIANAVISLVKGLTSLIEAINDFALIVETGIASLGTLVVDGFNCLFNDQEGLVATSKLWRNTKEAVAYSWTDTIFDNFYETDLGQWLDENAIGIFKSDGMGCQILEGLGYGTGVVILTVATFGSAAPLVLGGTATAAGIGKYSESEWNKNYLTVSYENGEQFNITLDYQQFKDLYQLNLLGDTREYTQTIVDENGNTKNITLTVSINENGSYDIYDNEGNKLNFISLNESNTAKGLGMATVYGLWEGVQYAVGAKIGTSAFSTLTSNISNPAIQKLAVSGIRIGLDTLTGVLEVPFQSLASMISEDISFTQAWQNNGGWTSVLSQAGIASIGSFIGETFELGKVLNNNEEIIQANHELLSTVTKYNVLLENSKRYSGNLLDQIKTEINSMDSTIAHYVSIADTEGLKNSILSIVDSAILFKYMSNNQIKDVLSILDYDQLDKLIRTSSNQKIIFDNLDLTVVEGSTLLTNQKRLVEKAASEGMNLKEFGAQKTKIDENLYLKTQELSSQVRSIALSAEPTITKVMESLETEYSILYGLEFKLKSLDSLTRKIISDANIEKISYEEAASKIGDSLRYTFVVHDEILYEDIVQNNLDQLVANGFQVSKFKNFWNKPGFKGINTTLISPEGLKLEVQFHTPESYYVKEDLTHLFYEIFRNENVPNEFREIANEIQLIYQSTVTIPDGILQYDYFNNLNLITNESIKGLSTNQIKTIMTNTTDEEINALFEQLSNQQKYRIVINTEFTKEILPKLNFDNKVKLITSVLNDGILLKRLTNIMNEQGLYSSFLNSLDEESFTIIASKVAEYNIPYDSLMNFLPRLSDTNIAQILSSQNGIYFNTYANLDINRLINIIYKEDIQNYNFINGLLDQDITRILKEFSFNKEIYSNIINVLSSEKLINLVKDGVLDIPSHIIITSSTGIEKNVSLENLLKLLSTNKEEFNNLLNDINNNSGIFKDANRFDYANAMMNFYNNLYNEGYSIHFNKNIRRNAIELINNFVLPTRNVNLNLWADTIMIKLLQKENIDYINEDKLYKIVNSFIFQKHEDFFAQRPIKNVMGYNNGEKSVLDLQYNDFIIKSTMTHESLHQLSFNEIDNLSQYAGIQYSRFNVVTLKWETIRSGLNESITEFINQRTMGEYYANFCGYNEAVECLKQIINLNIENFNVDTIKRAYFGNDESVLRNAIDKVMGIGFFDNLLVPAFDKAINPNREIGDLYNLIRQMALTIKGE